MLLNWYKQIKLMTLVYDTKIRSLIIMFKIHLQEYTIDVLNCNPNNQIDFIEILG